MLNLRVQNCVEDLITLQIYIEQGKTMNYKVFIYMPQCKYINIYGFGGGGGGGSLIRWVILAHIYPHLY